MSRTPGPRPTPTPEEPTEPTRPPGEGSQDGWVEGETVCTEYQNSGLYFNLTFYHLASNPAVTKTVVGDRCATPNTRG